jgi:trigger factor
LKIDSQPTEDHQVKLTVEVESDRFEQAKRQAAKKIARKAKIPGFRPGKAPYHMVVRHIGEEALVEEGLEILVDEIYPEVLKEADIHPYGPGKFDKLANLDPLTLEFTVPLRPEVTIPDYHGLRFIYDLPEITEEEVDSVIENLRQRHAVEGNVERPAEAGDRVQIRLSANRYLDEQSKEGDLLSERPHTLIIPDKAEEITDEWPFNGFARELIGASAGDKKILIHTFPEDDVYESLRGVNAEFHIEVVEIKSRTLPEVNDEFAKENGDYEDVAALRKDIRTALEAQSAEASNTEYDNKVIDAIITDSTIKYPPQLIDEEVNEVIARLESRLKNQGLDLDLYLKTRSLDMQGLREEARPTAETRIKRSLVLMEIANQEKIEVNEEELREQTTRTVESMSSYMSQTELNKLTSENAFPNLVGNIYADMRISRTVHYLRDLACGKLDHASETDTSQEPTVDTENARDKDTQSDIVDTPAETSAPIEETGGDG